MIPPEDCITSTRPCRMHVRDDALLQVAEITLIRGARYALTTVVEARSYSRNSGRMRCEAGNRHAQTSAAPLPRAARSPDSQTRRATRSRPLQRRSLASLDQSGQFLVRRRAQNLPFGAHALRHAKAQLARNKARRHRREPVVQPAPRLPADGNRIFESRSGHKRDPRAFALQHGVGSDRGAMAHVGCLPAPIRASASSTACEGSAGVEKIFQRPSARPSIEVDAIGKGAAGIDCYAQMIRSRPVVSLEIITPKAATAVSLNSKARGAS